MVHTLAVGFTQISIENLLILCPIHQVKDLVVLLATYFLCSMRHRGKPHGTHCKCMVGVAAPSPSLPSVRLAALASVGQRSKENPLCRIFTVQPCEVRVSKLAHSFVLVSVSGSVYSSYMQITKRQQRAINDFCLYLARCVLDMREGKMFSAGYQCRIAWTAIPVGNGLQYRSFELHEAVRAAAEYIEMHGREAQASRIS